MEVEDYPGRLPVALAPCSQVLRCLTFVSMLELAHFSYAILCVQETWIAAASTLTSCRHAVCQRLSRVALLSSDHGEWPSSYRLSAR